MSRTAPTGFRNFSAKYVWPKTKVRELFDSIYQEFPIGPFFLWVAGKEHNHLFRQIIDLGIPEAGEHDSVSFILDGQQRITSLFVTLKGRTVNGTDYRNIVFDLKEQKFKDRAPDDKRYVSVADIWGPEAMKLSRKIDEEFVAAYDRCYEVLRTYPTSVVEVRDKQLADVCKIFQRINQAGKRLDRFDLISAMTFTDDFDMRERFKVDVLAPLEKKLFGAIKPAIVTQLLALFIHGQCTERYEFSLTTDDIQKNWKSAVDAALLAADTLRKNMGVVNSGYLPYAPLMTLLAYYFMKSGNRSLPQEHLEWVQRWFWRASFAQYYTSGGPTKMGRDRQLFDELIAGGQPEFDVTVRLGVKPGTHHQQQHDLERRHGFAERMVRMNDEQLIASFNGVVPSGASSHTCSRYGRNSGNSGMTRNSPPGWWSILGDGTVIRPVFQSTWPHYSNRCSEGHRSPPNLRSAIRSCY